MPDPVTVSSLRQRMIEDMTIRQFGEHTQRDYVRQVRELTTSLRLPPDRAEPEDLRGNNSSRQYMRDLWTRPPS